MLGLLPGSAHDRAVNDLMYRILSCSMKSDITRQAVWACRMFARGWRSTGQVSQQPQMQFQAALFSLVNEMLEAGGRHCASGLCLQQCGSSIFS